MREVLLTLWFSSAAFVTIADTLTDDYDFFDLLQTLVHEWAGILDMQASGSILVQSGGQLQLMTSTSEGAGFVEITQLNAAAGPCIDWFHTGVAVSVEDIAETDRWPDFRFAAGEHGFHSSLATPMKLRGMVSGTMNRFGTCPGEVNDPAARVAQALAGVATIGIL